MATSNDQERHSYMLSLLRQWAYTQGFKMTNGHAYRCQDCPVGKKNSLHKSKLAQDYNLFIGAEIDSDGFLVGGKYTEHGEDYRPLAEYWESLHKENRSGIRYNDANHFETVPGYDNRNDPL